MDLNISPIIFSSQYIYNPSLPAHEEFKACLPDFHEEFLEIQQMQQEIDLIATFGTNPYTNQEVTNVCWFCALWFLKL